MSEIKTVAVLGTGVIGASWTSLFLANGLNVRAFDPAPAAEAALMSYIERAKPALSELGMSQKGELHFFADAVEAVRGAQFIQENVPERIEIKHMLYAGIEPALEPGAVLASSASGLMPSELRAGLKAPGRLVLGHPFNPPHLIPLVEVMGEESAAQTAEAFYQSLGKVTIRVNREAPGHVANRLQAAIWREAIHLVKEGVASLEDVDKAVWAGPGLRWAAMGPSTLFHLGAGEGGLTEFCRRYSASFNRWWDDLGTPHMDEETARMLAAGMAETGIEPESGSQKRDALIVAMLKAAQPIR